jgi:hypothetical protein
MRAVVKTVNQLPAKRKIAMFSHAGDRSDQEIQDLSKAVMGLNADLYIVAELERYLRGRSIGEIPQIVRDYLQQNGVVTDNIQQVLNPLEGAQLALKIAQPGDIVLLFVLSDRELVDAYLRNMAS